MHPFLVGFGSGMALIVAIGAQNAFVLRQGLRRESVGAVVAVCALSDALLIALGTLGVGAVAQNAPWALTALRWGGVAYLLWFAWRSFQSARKPGALKAGEATRGSVVATALALTFLNPHVYLDTVLLLGNITNSFGPLRWVCAAGAAVASIVWFVGLGFGAKALSKPLARPATWRVLDVVVGLTMLAVAARLAFGG